MARIIEARVIQKIDTEQNWNANELILYKGEIALVGDPDRVYNIKVGNGVKKFRDLPYMVDYINGLYTGVITPQSQVPSGINNVFLVTQPGTYTNFGGVVLPKDNLGIIYKNGNNFTIQLIPIVSEEKLQEYIDEKLVDINVGFGGEITDLNQSPTIDGMYMPKLNGIYPNFGNLEYNAIEGFVLFLYKDNQFSKITIPISSVENEVEFNNNILGVSGKAVEKYAVKKINTIADLRNINGEYNGQLVQLLGYYESGDKESLNYKWDSNKGVDDGGSVINTNNGSWIAIFGNEINSKHFGVFNREDISFGNYNDDTILFNKCRDYCINSKSVLIFDKGNYSIGSFVIENQEIKGYGTVNIMLKNNSNPVMAQFKVNSKCSNINFRSLHLDYEWQRCAIEQTNNVTLDNCGFFNFLNPSQLNSWGLYLANCFNIQINNCFFGSNSQSDIALVDNVRNVTINNPVNDIDDGVYLNIEPNGVEVVEDVLVQGGIFRQVDSFNYMATAEPINGINFIGCLIKKVRYSGGNINYSLSKITDIEQIIGVDNSLQCGVLDIKIDSGVNLVEDPFFQDVGAGRSWRYSFGDLYISREDKDYTQIGSSSDVGVGYFTSSEINITQGKKYVLNVNGWAEYSNVINNIGKLIIIEFYDNLDSSLGALYPYIFKRGILGGKTDIKNQMCIIDTSLHPNCEKIRIHVGNYVVSNNNIININNIFFGEITGYNNLFNTKIINTAKYHITSDSFDNQIGYKRGDLLIAPTKLFLIKKGTLPIEATEII